MKNLQEIDAPLRNYCVKLRLLRHIMTEIISGILSITDKLVNGVIKTRNVYGAHVGFRCPTTPCHELIIGLYRLCVCIIKFNTQKAFAEL
jgi:hypothetical protein